MHPNVPRVESRRRGCALYSPQACWATPSCYSASQSARRAQGAQSTQSAGRQPPPKKTRSAPSRGLDAELVRSMAGRLGRRELSGAARKRALAAGADEGLHLLAFLFDGRPLEVGPVAPMSADPVHPGRLRVKAVYGDLPADGAGASHWVLTDTEHKRRPRPGPNGAV